jgi:phage tail tape-measure protein
MFTRITTLLIAGAALSACTTTGNVERNAAGGAAIGALGGAIIGNNVGDGDAGTGAAIGGVLGAGAGAARGYGQDQKLEDCRRFNNERLYRDNRTGESFYYIPGTNRTCWSDGRIRS